MKSSSANNFRPIHYYPFGLTMSGISSKAVAFGGAENKRKFNEGTELENKEFSDGSGLELYSTEFRNYDAQIGRFHQIDELADMDDSWSPYVFAYNNPILLNDPLGLSADSTKPVNNPTITDPNAPKGSEQNPHIMDEVIITNVPAKNPWIYRPEPVAGWNPQVVTYDPMAKRNSGGSNAGQGIIAGTIAVRDPRAVIVTLTVVTAYILITNPGNSGDGPHYFNAPDNTTIYHPPYILKAKDNDDNLKGGKQNQRDADIKQYPTDFQRWYHREYKPKVNPGRNATPQELKEAYDDWVSEGKPKIK